MNGTWYDLGSLLGRSKYPCENCSGSAGLCMIVALRGGEIAHSILRVK